MEDETPTGKASPEGQERETIVLIYSTARGKRSRRDMPGRDNCIALMNSNDTPVLVLTSVAGQSIGFGKNAVSFVSWRGCDSEVTRFNLSGSRPQRLMRGT